MFSTLLRTWNMRQNKVSGQNLQIVIAHPVFSILWMGLEHNLQWFLLRKGQKKSQTQNVSKTKTWMADVAFSLTTDLYPGSPLSLIQEKSLNATPNCPFFTTLNIYALVCFKAKFMYTKEYRTDMQVPWSLTQSQWSMPVRLLSRRTITSFSVAN